MSSQPSALPATPFLERLIRFLMPYFIDIAVDTAAARAEILETIGSYGARTRSEMLNAAQIIAYGLSALEMLSDAKTTEMSHSMRLRFRGCANGLNRAGQQNEKVLAKRLACDRPVAETPVTDPVNDLADARIEEVIDHTANNIVFQRALERGAALTSAKPQPAPSSGPDPYARMWGEAMVNVLAEMGMPVQPVPSPMPNR